MIKGKIKEILEQESIIRSVKNTPLFYDDSKRILIIDADSILYTSTYFPEDSIMLFPDEKTKLEEAKFRINNKIQEIQNNVEEYYNIIKTFIFVGGKNNFRYKLFPEYKLHRKDKEINTLLIPIKKYLIENLNAIESDNAEADDYVIEAMLDVNKNCVIAAIDKDIIYHAPSVPIYDYRSYNDVLGEFKSITINQSRLAIASQIIIGDSCDGIPGAAKLGKTWCLKNLNENMTNYQFIKNLYLGYLKAYKTPKLAKQKLKLFYIILKLHTQKEITALLKKYDYK